MKLAGKSEGRSRALIIALVFSLFFLVGCSDAGLATPTPATNPTQAASTVATPAAPNVNPFATTAASATTAGTTVSTVPATTAQAATTAPTTIPSTAPATTSPPKPTSLYNFPYADSQYYVHLPPHIKSGPLQVVLAIHGMGNNGQAFAQPLIPYADEYGFVLVAPTMKYDSNYSDPANIAANDAVLLPELDKLLDRLPTQLGYPVSQKALVFGFSRGGQIAHRFAFFYPERVLGVAAISAGNYTLPAAQYRPENTTSQTDLRFPFGIADLSHYIGHEVDLPALRQVSFWLAVGGADVGTKDVPVAWTPYLGQTRVERTTRFYKALQNAGISATLNVFPGVDHSICTGMKQGAFAFFNGLNPDGH